MPAKDIHHDAVRNALVKDGWTITHDPYTISFGSRDVFVDLGAESPLAAEKGDEKIAVEVKSFRGPSEIHNFEVALGRFLLCRSLMSRTDLDRKLYLAVTDITHANTFRDPAIQAPLEDFRIPLIVFRPGEERIIRWIP